MQNLTRSDLINGQEPIYEMTSRRGSRAGFTLPELIVVIALLAIVCRELALGFGAMHAASILKREAEILKIDLGIAALLAQQKETDILVLLDSRGYEFRAESEVILPASGYRFHEATRLAVTGRLLPHALRFVASGVASPATIVLTHKGSSCRITLALRGRVRTDCLPGES